MRKRKLMCCIEPRLRRENALDTFRGEKIDAQITRLKQLKELLSELLSDPETDQLVREEIMRNMDQIYFVLMQGSKPIGIYTTAEQADLGSERHFQRHFAATLRSKYDCGYSIHAFEVNK